MKTGPHQLSLKWDFAFEDLYRREGLERLDAIFSEHLQSTDAALHARFGAFLSAVKPGHASPTQPPGEVRAPHVEWAR